MRFLLAQAAAQEDEQEGECADGLAGADPAAFLRLHFQETTDISSTFLAEHLLPTLNSMIAMLPDPNVKIVAAKIMDEYGKVLKKEAFRNAARMIAEALPKHEVGLLDKDPRSMYRDLTQSSVQN